ncbi:uncharacterized protein NMK_1969 [Novimethylophilus kurashikiensis]|uniref:Uncharacterized protein n=1 Tax=Novimethylophilus kurashikiensis TaxID=1825523 RepID=A0A2R5F7Z9_9PROT|nr:hypothetical protein [Novimethylophilus kurashikiensis]GBG14370.1 uncharacterized protein NMK_1969 [Novimethylophilus kurashikiensis]
MNFNITVQRLLLPLLLKSDFRSPIWAGSVLEARLWLFGSVPLNLLALYLVGELTMGNIILTLLSPFGIVWFSARLALALGCMQVSVALISILVVCGMIVLHIAPTAILVTSYFIQLWSVIAMIHVIVKYLRTPKNQLPLLA